MFSDEDGRLAVKAARSVVESHVKRESLPKLDLPNGFKNKSGVFVTLTTHPRGDLRGCIGYPEPLLALEDALRDSAVSACSRDPRFPPVKRDELDTISIEVSLLTPPEEIKVKKPAELPMHVVVGSDGLIVQRGLNRGLLLPQVPVEWEWGPEEFLSHTCLKAGLTPDAWLRDGTKVFKFQAEVFSEDTPRGTVERRSLDEEHGACR
jgi:uncharacterized protein (TIGR00296 family)